MSTDGQARSGSVGGRLDGLTSAAADWSGLRVVVAGLGVSGFAAADALHERGARVVAVDGAEPRQPTSPLTERARILDILGVDVRVGPEHVTGLPAGRGTRPRRHLARAGAPTSRCCWPPRRPAYPSGVRSSWPGGCARRWAPRPG